MPDSDSPIAPKLGNWQFPAVMVAIFTFLGLRSGDSGPPSSVEAEAKAESLAEEEKNWANRKESVPDLVDEFRPISTEAKLAVLMPLVKFYAPAIDAMRESDLEKNAGRNQDDMSPALSSATESTKAGKTLEALVSILRSESRKFREMHPQGGQNAKSTTDPNVSPPARPVSLKILVGIVPDPKDSGIAYQYDSAMFGIRSAFGEQEFVIHSHSIPWSGAEKGNRPANAKAKENVPETGRLPGAILFRKPFGKDGRLSEAGTDLIDLHSPFELGLVLLVPEKPLAGIDVAVFLKALEIAEYLNEAVMSDTEGGAIEKPNPIRIFGPTYSGSDVSMMQVLRRWSERQSRRTKGIGRGPGATAAPVPGSSRVVMLWHNGDALKFAPATYEIPAKDSREIHQIQYRTFGPRNDDYLEALTEYVRKSLAPALWNRRIAIVSEGSTTYGAKFEGKSAKVIEDDQDRDKIKFFNYRYPLNIAEMRRRVEKSKKQGDDANLRIRTTEQLELDLGNDQGSDEIIEYALPAYSVNVDELRLLRVAEEINRQRIRYVIVRSSDVRDLIFVCEFFAEHCPDVQLMAVNSDITLNHSERIVDLRGLVVASGLPTYVGELMEENSQQPDAAGLMDNEQGSERRGDVFPDSTAAANHVAVSEHLKWRIPDAERKETPTLPVRISVNSQKGFLNLATFEPVKNTTDDKGPELELLEHRTKFPMTSGVSLFLTIPIFLLGVLVFVWYRYRFASSLKQMSSVSTMLGRTPRPQAANAGGKKHRKSASRPDAHSAANTTMATQRNVASGDRNFGSDYLGRLQASAISFLNFLEMRASIFDHFRMIWNRNSLRIMAIPVLTIMTYYSVRMNRIFEKDDFTMPSVPGFLLCFILAGTTDRIARWNGRSDAFKSWESESNALRILRYSLTFFVALFIWFAISNVSTFESGLTEYVLIGLISISVIVVAVMTYRINLVWNLFSSISTNIQGLPMGDIFERLPRRLTSKPGDFNELWFETNDAEVNPRIGQILKRTRQLMIQEMARIESSRKSETPDAKRTSKDEQRSERQKSRGSNETRADFDKRNPEQASHEIVTSDEFEFSHRLVLTILKPVWDSRLTSEAYADRDEKTDAAAKPAPDGDRTDPDLERQAETLVAIMLVHFVNRGMDLVWTFIITTILLAMLMLVMINSYPFQPAGSISTWISLFVFLAIISCFRVYFGMNRDGLLSRVHRTPDGKSIFDSDFLGKGLLYLAPVLTLLSSLSVGFSEVIRIVLLPIFS